MNSTKQIRVPLFDLRVLDTNLRAELTEAFTTVLDHGRLFGGGPELNRFEKIIASEIGTRYAVGVGSGSSALYMALKTCGIGLGDEVITTPLTFVATCNAISYCGARPVFVDVDCDTLGLCPESLAEFLEQYGEVRTDGHCWNPFTEGGYSRRAAKRCGLQLDASGCFAYSTGNVVDLPIGSGRFFRSPY